MVVLIALLLVISVVLLLSGSCQGPSAPPSGAPARPDPGTVEPGPAVGPNPTLPVTFNGYRYSIGVSALTPVVQAGVSGTRSAPPGRHFLTATMVIRNDQTDRTAPALLNSDGDAPRVAVGLSPVDYLPPVHSLGIPKLVSDCNNDPRQPKVFTNPRPEYAGIPAATCIVDARAVPANPVSSLESDRQMAPGGVTYGVVTTIDVPDDVPTPTTSTWMLTGARTTTAGPQSTYQAIAVQ